MKAALSACLFASILAVGATHATAAHAKSRHQPKKRALSVAKRALSVELPANPGVLGDAPKHGRASFWLAADPHVPLATVQGKAIRSVGKRGKECGATERWANPRSRWHAIDAWGQRTGLYEVTGSEAFDVTGCREVVFAARSGKPGAGLFVSDDSAYAPVASVADTVSVPEKKRFERFLGVLEGSFVNQKPLGKRIPWSKRTMFFHFDAPHDKSLDGRVDGAGKPIARPRRWAVSGGPLLVVSYLGDKGQWKASTVKMPLGLADSYQPVAVFDMNGDGVPEIVVRASDGPTFADRVLALDPATMTWSEAAESPGGGAL